jgi:hypothetical protein
MQNFNIEIKKYAECCPLLEYRRCVVRLQTHVPPKRLLIYGLHGVHITEDGRIHNYRCENLKSCSHPFRVKPYNTNIQDTDLLDILGLMICEKCGKV